MPAVLAAEAARLAARLGVSTHDNRGASFPDGELRVTVGPAAATTIVYASLDHPNDKLLALLFAAEALRRGGAQRLVLVAPYLCYMRQDAAFHDGEAISQKVDRPADRGQLRPRDHGRCPSAPHQDIDDVFPGIEADNLSAMPAIADCLRAAGIDPATVVVGPDVESRPWVADLARPARAAHAVAHKTRRGDRSVEIASPIRRCSPAGRRCWSTTSSRQAAP